MAFRCYKLLWKWIFSKTETYRVPDNFLTLGVITPTFQNVGVNLDISSTIKWLPFFAASQVYYIKINTPFSDIHASAWIHFNWKAFTIFLILFYIVYNKNQWQYINNNVTNNHLSIADFCIFIAPSFKPIHCQL
jgi:hypothetical protein